MAWHACAGHTLMAYEFDDPFAALMSSSARHSAMDLTLRNADSRVYIWNENMFYAV